MVLNRLKTNIWVLLQGNKCIKSYKKLLIMKLVDILKKFRMEELYEIC